MLVEQFISYFITFLVAFGSISLLRAFYTYIRDRTKEVVELKPSRTKQVELPYISADILAMLCQDNTFHSLVFDEHGVHLVINE